MGVFNKFKDLVGIEEIDEEDYENEIAESTGPAEKKAAEPRNQYSRAWEPREKITQMTDSKNVRNWWIL